MSKLLAMLSLSFVATALHAQNSASCAVSLPDANYALNQSQQFCPTLTFSGALTADRTVFSYSSAGQQYTVSNATTGGFAVIISGSRGSAVSVPSGGSAIVLNTDGQNFAQINGSAGASTTDASQLTTGILPAARIATASVPVNKIDPASGALSVSVIPQTYGSNPRFYGAIADGNSHPASSSFGTLAACQAVYPTCAALTDEIDTLALEKARANAVNTPGGNDTLVVPAGRYKLSRTFTIAVDTIQTTPSGSALSIMGAGSNATFFEPASSLLTSGNPVIACGNGVSDTYANSQGRYSGQGGCSGTFQGFTIRPGRSCQENVTPCFDAPQYSGTAPTYNGVAVTNDGIYTGARMQLFDVIVEGFVHGLNVVGDHENWVNFKAIFNQDGVFFAEESQFLFGDITWTNPLMSANTRSGIYISKDAYASVTVAGQLYVSGSPYAIRGQGGAYAHGPGYHPMLLNFSAPNILSEYLGNSFLSDENMDDVAALAYQNAGNGYGSHTGRPNTSVQLSNLQVRGCSGLSYCHPITTGNQGHYAWITAGSMEGVKLALSQDGFQPDAGMNFGIVTAQVGTVAGGLNLDLNPLLVESFGAANVPMLGGFIYGVNDNACQNVKVTTNGRWEGTCAPYPVSGTYYTPRTSLPAGLLMRYQFGNQVVVNGQYDQQQYPAGVNMQPWTSSAINGSFTLVATRGVISNIPYGGSLQSGGFAYSGSGAPSGGVLPCGTSATTPCTSGFAIGQVAGYNTGSSTATIRLAFGGLQPISTVAPSTSTDICTPGEIRVLSGFLEACTSPNVFQRVALNAF